MTNATGTDAWDFSKAVSGTADGAASILKLYARWEKADTSYTVRVWKENLTSTDHEANNAKHENGTVDYLLADFRSISAPTGAVIDVTKDQDIQNYIKEEAGKSYRSRKTGELLPPPSVRYLYELSGRLQKKGAMTDVYIQEGGRHCEADWEKQNRRYMEFLWM